MWEPRRLLEGCSDEYQLDLLRSWHAEEPSAEAVTRAARALGVGSGVLGASLLSSAPAGALGASSAAVSGAAIGMTVLKWCAGGALGALLAGGGAVYALSTSAQSGSSIASGRVATHPS